MLTRSHRFDSTLVLVGPVEQPELGFDRQYPADGIVDALHWDVPGVHCASERLDERTPIVGNHDHVHSGVDGRHGGRVVVRMEAFQGQPIRNEESVEAELFLQHLRQEVVMPRELLSAPAAQRHHDVASSGRDRGDVRGQMDSTQFLFVDRGHALVHALAPDSMLVQLTELVLVLLEDTAAFLTDFLCCRHGAGVIGIRDVGMLSGRTPLGSSVGQEVLDRAEHGSRMRKARSIDVLETPKEGGTEVGNHLHVL